ncbi:MAG: DNA polymerase III subunit delta [Anaerovoracaceae bacterium]
MRYYDQRSEEHSFRRIARLLKSDEIPTLLYLYGEENFLIQWSIEEIEKKYIEEASSFFNKAMFIGTEWEPDQVIETIETLPMMSEKKIVVLRGFGDKINQWVKSQPDQSVKAFATVISTKQKESIIILTGKEMPESWNKGVLQDSIKNNALALKFDALNNNDAKKFIKQRFAEEKVTIENHLIAKIINDSNYIKSDEQYNLSNLQTDIYKIIALAKYRASEESAETIYVAEEDIENGLSRNLESDVFKMLDFMLQGKQGESVKIFNDLILAGESQFRLIGSIVSQLDFLVQVKEIKMAGLSFEEALKVLKLKKSFRYEKGLAIVKSISIEMLRASFLKALALDKQIKSGTIDQNLAIECFILSN